MLITRVGPARKGKGYSRQRNIQLLSHGLYYSLLDMPRGRNLRKYNFTVAETVTTGFCKEIQKVIF